MSKGRKVAFLDRDGLINRQAAPHQYIIRKEDFSFLPGVPEAIRRLNEAGYLVLVVTNQRGVARGMLTMAEVEGVHHYMCNELESQGAHIDRIYVCPHNEGECNCRKPNVGLFLQAEQEYDIDKSNSWMIGDSITDMQAGRNYGIRSMMTDNLSQAVEIIISREDFEP